MHIQLLIMAYLWSFSRILSESRASELLPQESLHRLVCDAKDPQLRNAVSRLKIDTNDGLIPGQSILLRAGKTKTNGKFQCIASRHGVKPATSSYAWYEVASWSWDIVADGWKGASNPNSLSTLKFPTKMDIKHISTCAYKLIDQQMDRRTNIASYRVACPQLKWVTNQSRIDGTIIFRRFDMRFGSWKPKLCIPEFWKAFLLSWEVNLCVRSYCAASLWRNSC